MLSNTSNGTARPFVPTLADIQHRRATLLGLPHPPPAPPMVEAPPPGAAPPRARIPQPPQPIPDDQPMLAQSALHGPAGDAVRILAPQSEAHPAALLLQLLAAFGNLIGRGPHCMVNTTRHALNLYVVLVGDSSKARKGTSWALIAHLLAQVDQPWLSTRVITARLTAASLAHALRDQQPPTDRRFLALSEEFASILQTLNRAKGQLSPLLRTAWDHGDLGTLGTLDPKQQGQATQSHISLIAHITQRELAHSLYPTEAHNGFANRCLWTWVQRTQCLPDGGSFPAQELSAVARELRRALLWAAATPKILFERDPAARELWHHRYPSLSQHYPGLRGAATSRAEAQVLRLSAIYAALDTTSVIAQTHLEAALAVWDYCAASATFLFGTSTGDLIADRIRDAIANSEKGLSKDQIRRLFHGHVDSDRIDAALDQLVALGAIGSQIEPTGGRPSTLWSASASESEDASSAEYRPSAEGA